MRVRCPKCSQAFSAKANARRIKCPHCDFRQEMPPEGLANAPAAWKKANPESFRLEQEPKRSKPPLTRNPAFIWAAVAIAALLVLAGWWAFAHGDKKATPGAGNVTKGQTSNNPTAGVTPSSPVPTPQPSASSTCASVPNAPLATPGPVEVDFITPGVWNVCADTDYAYAWVHDNGTAALDYTLSITGEGGASLPAGWSVTFAKPSGHIAAWGAKDDAWASSLATLTIPSTEPAGVVNAELHAGGVTRAFTFHVQASRGTVAKPGQSANTHYDLKHSNGAEVQTGEFCVRLAGPNGNGNAVLGYGWGVIGVAQGETILLVVPPPFGYGYSGGPLSGDTLRWMTTVTGIDNC